MKTGRIRKTTVMIGMVALLAAAWPARAGAGDNAALLYYQAFLLYEKPDAALEQMLDNFRAGKIDANEAIRTHLEKNRRVIEYIVKAASLPSCDWGYDYSQGIDLTLVNPQAVKRIAFLLSTDACWLAHQGDYRTALDRCLTAHRMALHTVDRTLVPYLVGIGVSGVTNRTIQRVLATVPDDIGTLTRFKDQMQQIREAFPPLADMLVQESQVCAATMRKDKVPVVIRVLEQDYEGFAASATKQRLLAGDEVFFERNRTYWFSTIAALAAVLKSGQPYPQVYAQLEELEKKRTGESKDNPDATFTGFSLGAVSRIYLLATRLQTHFNAIQLAIDLYTIRARTGKLPDTLPASAPPDLFSGQPFEYEKAPDHFTLRCRAKEEPEKAEANSYEFKIGK
jgi:hypothetical protein